MMPRRQVTLGPQLRFCSAGLASTGQGRQRPHAPRRGPKDVAGVDMQEPSEWRGSSAPGPELWGACARERGVGSKAGALGGADWEGDGKLWRGDCESVLGWPQVCGPFLLPFELERQSPHPRRQSAWRAWGHLRLL